MSYIKNKIKRAMRVGELGVQCLTVVVALAVLLGLSGVITPPVLAQMNSTNYKIPFDSINVGGLYSTSTNYGLEDSVGQSVSGPATSTSYQLQSGYQQVDEESFISISAEADVILPSISGVIGGVATSSSTWTVTTNNNAGYELQVRASTSPALQASLSGSSFADYAPAGAEPDFSFSVASTESKFGFTPEGADIISRFKDDGVDCATGSSDTSEKCWDGFSTTDVAVAQGSANDPTGSETTIIYRAEAGSEKWQTAGDYSAIITVTAVAL